MIHRFRPSAQAVARCLAALGCAAVTAACAEASTARIEVHVLPSLNLTRPQLLTGRQAGAVPAAIAGELSLPFVAAVRMPAVLMLHGDAGAVANQVAWREDLNAIGVAVFTLDSFSGRGAVATGASLATMPDSIGGLSRVVDAERALALLAKHPRIDPARIAVMGFSSGGKTALAAAQSRFAAAFGTPGLHFAAYIALYPDCSVRLIGEAKTEPGPQRIFIGEADVLTSAAACVAFGARQRDAGVDVTVTTFAGAHHGFDNVGVSELTRIPGVPTVAECTFEETPEGAIVNADTQRPLGDDDKCIGHGLIAGYDAAANSGTRAAVKEFLSDRFGLRPGESTH